MSCIGTPDDASFGSSEEGEKIAAEAEDQGGALRGPSAYLKCQNLLVVSGLIVLDLIECCAIVQSYCKAFNHLYSLLECSLACRQEQKVTLLEGRIA